MAALLTLIPRYLPRYGMAPNWAAAVRPLVVAITFVNVIVTIVFRADVDAQAGAFATGLLMLFTSAALAVLLSVWQEGLFKRFYFLGVLLIFIYTTILNMITRPEGLQISMVFIALILLTSLASWAIRSTELRSSQVQFDDQAQAFIGEAVGNHWGEIRILAHRPDDEEHHKKEQVSRRKHSIQQEEGNFIFLEVSPGDASEFAEDVLEVTGHLVGQHRVLRCTSPAVPNAIAAILLHIRKLSGKVPHVYMAWTEGHPLAYVFKYIFFGEGETAPVTREILRKVEPDEALRPEVHVA